MQPEEFMREYFRERTERLRAEVAAREPFRQKFYTSDCCFDSQHGVVERSEAEVILDVSHFGNGEVRVTTNWLGGGNRLQYHLQPAGDRWLIDDGEIECVVCCGTGKKKGGNAQCLICNGKGWMIFPKEPFKGPCR